MPSTVIFDQTYNWHGQYIVGDATIRVTVTEDDSSGDDLYLWNYALTNDPNNGWNFEMLAVPNKDPNGWGTDAMALTIGDIASDQEGWDGGPYGSPSRPIGATDEYIWWGDETGDPILPGGSVNLSFTTAPTTISSGTGLVSASPGGFANTLYGTIAVPEVPDPHEVRTKSDQGIMNDGRVSLREAVTYTLNHQDKGTDVWFGVASPITLDPNQGQIELGKGGNTTEINIGGPMTIQRDSSSPVNHRIFKILPNTTVKLSSLDLRNGKVTDAGGAIFSEGNLTVDACSFVQNEATGSAGGAIDASSGSLDVHGVSSFTGNKANLGGAIYVGQRVAADISYSTFTLNSATSGQFGQGGAIFIRSSTTATATSVSISNADVNGNVATDRGGGIFVSAVESGTGTELSVSATTIQNNVVTSGTGKGGGLFFASGTLGLFYVTFSDNTAFDGNGFYLVTGTTLDENSVYYLDNGDTWNSGPY